MPDTSDIDYHGPVWDNVMPGSAHFENLVKSVATLASNSGKAKHNSVFVFNNPPKDLVRAQEKIEQAHKLLLGANALMAELHYQAKVKKK